MINKKPNHKYIILRVLILTMLTSLCGCSTDPLNFSTGDLTITLTKQFTEEKKDGFNMYLESDNVLFSAIERRLRRSER